jgi:phage recombination protein Bet
MATKQAIQPTAATTSLRVQYTSAFGDVELSYQTVKDFLVRGNKEAVSDQEVKLFMELCKFQKLNPFTNEVYLIKFGSDPAQMVVGRDAYLRRAYENPDYLGYTSGVTVMRGNDVVQKQGTCVYPGEKLIGGWCRVRRKLCDLIAETFKEVSLEEYNKGQANWKTKPSLMIAKVAESQALRAAFPRDFSGLYTDEEIVTKRYNENGGDCPVLEDTTTLENDPPITQSQRQEIFKKAKEKFGAEANDVLVKIIAEFGLSSTNGMLTSVCMQVLQRIDAWEEPPVAVIQEQPAAELHEAEQEPPQTQESPKE